MQFLDVMSPMIPSIAQSLTSSVSNLTRPTTRIKDTMMGMHIILSTRKHTSSSSGELFCLRTKEIEGFN